MAIRIGGHAGEHAVVEQYGCAALDKVYFYDETIAGCGLHNHSAKSRKGPALNQYERTGLQPLFRLHHGAGTEQTMNLTQVVP